MAKPQVRSQMRSPERPSQHAEGVGGTGERSILGDASPGVRVVATRSNYRWLGKLAEIGTPAPVLCRVVSVHHAAG